MVEPVSAGVLVAALIAKALDRAEDGVLDGAAQAARKAVERLRQRFAGDAEAEQAIGRMEDAPDSEKREHALATLLAARAGESAELRTELEEIIESLQSAGVKIGDTIQVAKGHGNVQTSGTVNSDIRVNQFRRIVPSDED